MDPLEELQKQLDAHMEEMNATPREEFDNLSPNDMWFILYQTLAEGSPIQYQAPLSNEVLQKVPFFRLFLEYLKEIDSAGEMKLTAKGNLPRKLCLELYGTGIIKEEYIERGIVKLNKEADSIVLQNLKIMGTMTRITKKRNNKLSLTKLGEKLFHAPKQDLLFKTIFETYAFRFNLGYHDNYPQDSPVQSVLGYTFYLLLRYGNELRELEFYANKNIEAFPNLLEYFYKSWSTPEIQYQSCYQCRIFDRFLDYFGLVEMEKESIKGEWREKVRLKATPLFRELFELRKENFRFQKGKYSA